MIFHQIHEVKCISMLKRFKDLFMYLFICIHKSISLSQAMNGEN